MDGGGGGGGARPCIIYNLEAISAFSLSLLLFTHMFDNKERTGVLSDLVALLVVLCWGDFFFFDFQRLYVSVVWRVSAWE